MIPIKLSAAESGCCVGESRFQKNLSRYNEIVKFMFYTSETAPIGKMPAWQIYKPKVELSLKQRVRIIHSLTLSGSGKYFKALIGTGRGNKTLWCKSRNVLPLWPITLMLIEEDDDDIPESETNEEPMEIEDEDEPIESTTEPAESTAETTVPTQLHSASFDGKVSRDFPF